MTSRISHLVARGNLVVISAHSHGCVLVAASVLQLRPQVQRRVALLTHGCPLRRLYAGLFPAYVGEDVLHELGERVGWRWVNLWRDTDPIGGWIFSADRPGETPAAAGPPNAVDRRLRDPREVTPPQYDSVAPSIQGHWPCCSDERYQAAVCELTGQLRRLDDAGEGVVPGAPMA